MKASRFRRMLTWAVAGPVALLALLAVTFLLVIRGLNREAEWVEHADLVISAARQTQALLIDMETGVRGYLLTGNAAFLAPYDNAVSAVEASFHSLRMLVRDDPQQSSNAARIDHLYREWRQLAAEMVSSAQNPATRSAAQVTGKEEMDAIRVDFSAFIQSEELHRTQRSSSVRRFTRNVVMGTTAAALLLGVIVGLFARRALKIVASEYRDALVESERMYQEAEDANRAKDDFLATLSHELRTPLTAILGWSRLLLMDEEDAERRKAYLAIERSARAQATLIDDILDVSRAITGKLQLKLGTVDVAAAVQHAIDSVKPAADAKEIVIDADVASPLELTADADRLQQIIWNLLANAVKFSARGTTIRVSAENEGDNVQLVVADEGVGIDPAFLPYVFDRFRQADSTSTREHGGLGIGLSVVKLLVEVHGGTVRAQSEGVGKGATFVVKLPIRQQMTNAAAPREVAAYLHNA